MRHTERMAFAVTMLVMGASGAWSQATAPAPSAATPSPVGPDPATTTATYGDWVLRCQAPTAASGQKRICEVVQTMQVQGQQEPVAQVAFGRVQGGADLHLVVALPVNVSFPSAVLVTIGDKDQHPFSVEWKRCIPGACFADAVAPADLIGRWRTTATGGRVMFKDAAARDLILPLSFRGLAPALDALAKST